MGRMVKPTLPALIIAGFGSVAALQLTLETQQLAVRAGKVIAIGLPPRIASLLKRQGVGLTELDDAFEAVDSAVAYARVAETVLATAAQDPPVLFLSQGSPLLLNSITRYLAVEARARNLSVLILPGVSPVDAVVADLGIDVGGSGLQIIAARGFIDRPDLINPGMPLLLLEAGASLSSGDGSGREALPASLRRRYPETQPITALKPSANGLTRKTARLSRFHELEAALEPSASLFVDVARGRPANEEDG